MKRREKTFGYSRIFIIAVVNTAGHFNTRVVAKRDSFLHCNFVKAFIDTLVYLYVLGRAGKAY